MDGLLGRLYRRLGRYYLLLLPVPALLLAIILPVLVVYIAAVRYIGLPQGDFWRITWWAIAGVEIGTASAVVLILFKSRPLVRWVGGQRDADNAAPAWKAAVEMPDRHPLIAPWPISLGAAPAIIAIYNASKPQWYSIVAMLVGCFIVVALGIALHMVATEMMLRPVILEIDEMYPHISVEGRAKSRSLRRRLIFSSLLVVWISGLMATALVVRTSDPLAQLTATVAATLGVSLTFGLVLTLALSRTLFGPLRELAQANTRVQRGDLSARIPLISSDELGQLARSFNDMVGGLADREALRSALGAYVEPGIAERLLAEGEVLVGEEMDVTVMFVDIVAFSARAEMLPAESVLAELNQFFGLVVPIIESHEGHANKLLGDGLMAVFGTPIRHSDHADRAVITADEIQTAMSEKYGSTVRVGIGINTGRAVVGTTGGGKKLDFTVIGDVVNVASRVEALTRETGDAILLTEATKLALTRTTAALASRGTAEIKGRAEPASLYALVSRVPA